ncbi:hypothetical protein SAMN05661099_0497 [Daejeonella lutea]|uniref:Uncharacterized protein n=1 Tax=Daejeonella lutea TaxID=572036 RepID=A0A1T5AA88_9SPHI|nr:hypothetical protein SAMN05661099_0497 [Daejeonella lutea]
MLQFTIVTILGEIGSFLSTQEIISMPEQHTDTSLKVSAYVYVHEGFNTHKLLLKFGVRCQINCILVELIGL